MKTKKIMVALLALGAYFTSNAQNAWIEATPSPTISVSRNANIVLKPLTGTGNQFTLNNTGFTLIENNGSGYPNGTASLTKSSLVFSVGNPGGSSNPMATYGISSLNLYNPSSPAISITCNGCASSPFSVSSAGVVTAATVTATGAATVGSLTTIGAATVGSLMTTGAATAASLTTTGAATVGSLTTTGAATVGSLISNGTVQITPASGTGFASTISTTGISVNSMNIGNQSYSSSLNSTGLSLSYGCQGANYSTTISNTGGLIMSNITGTYFSVSNAGNTTIGSTSQPTSLGINGNIFSGSAIGIALTNGNGYLGFNALRNVSAGTWALANTSTGNGGGIMYSTTAGDIVFTSIASTNTTTSQTVTDASVNGNAMLRITPTTVLAKQIQVKTSVWADYVFNKDYKLRPLQEVEAYISANNHLPEVPSESEVVKDGINVSEMNATLLKKVEELTLYMIQQQKEMIQQQKEIEALKLQSSKK